jgi:hypothetical protein
VVVNAFPLPFTALDTLSRDARQKVVLENKKGIAENRYPLKMSTKKGKVTPLIIRGYFALIVFLVKRSI